MDVAEWMVKLISTHAYLGTFITSIFFPVPYLLVVSAYQPTLNPLLLGFVAGAGATVGELAAYLLGYGGRVMVEGKYGQRLETAKKLFQRHGEIIVFLYSLFPLPTGPVLVPLGLLKFRITKALMAVFLGKTIQCTLVAYAGKHSVGFVIRIFESQVGVLGGFLSIIVLVLVIYALISVDWSKCR